MKQNWYIKWFVHKKILLITHKECFFSPLYGEEMGKLVVTNKKKCKRKFFFI